MVGEKGIEGMPDLTFWDQVRLDVIDKLLLGAIIGIAGLYANSRFEKYKANLALEEAIAEKRIGRTIPLQDKIGKLEIDLITAHVRLAAKLVDDKGPADRRGRALAEIAAMQDRGGAIESEIIAAKFWLGPELKERHLKHIHAIIDCCEAIKKQFSSLFASGQPSTEEQFTLIERVISTYERTKESDLSIDQMIDLISRR